MPGLVALLDPCSTAYPLDLRMGDPSILGNLTEEILSIDRLKPAAEQSVELEPETAEFALLALYHLKNDFGGAELAGVDEHF